MLWEESAEGGGSAGFCTVMKPVFTFDSLGQWNSEASKILSTSNSCPEADSRQRKSLELSGWIAESAQEGEIDQSKAVWAGRSFMCTFSGRQSLLEVHPAPPKRLARMREKLAKYLPPHPRSRWPLAANILDPIRASGVSLAI